MLRTLIRQELLTHLMSGAILYRSRDYTPACHRQHRCAD